MRRHPRESVVQQAESLFGLGWLEIEARHDIATYAPLHLALNAIDHHWIHADLVGLPIAEANSGWESCSLAQLHGPVLALTREIGQLLADLSEAHELTYGEIMMILAQQRMGLAKYHIRAERHPGESGKPGGVA